MNIFNPNKKVLFSTLSHPHHHHHHPPTWSATAAVLTGSTWFTAVGLGLAAASILFAPAHEFDNLDCQSYCQRVVDGREQPPHHYYCL